MTRKTKPQGHVHLYTLLLALRRPRLLATIHQKPTRSAFPDSRDALIGTALKCLSSRANTSPTHSWWERLYGWELSKPTHCLTSCPFLLLFFFMQLFIEITAMERMAFSSYTLLSASDCVVCMNVIITIITVILILTITNLHRLSFKTLFWVRNC